MDLVGAMGLDNPDKLSADQILCRVENKTTKHYDEIYNPLSKNELLTETIHPFYAQHWKRAQSDRFA